MNIVKFSDVIDKVVAIRSQKVILDFHVAELYGVETKEINQAVKNNPRKFPKEYIIEAFDKLTELKETVAELSETKDEATQKDLMQKGGEIIAEIIGNELETSDTETSIEINFAVLKFKHTIKRNSKK